MDRLAGLGVPLALVAAIAAVAWTYQWMRRRWDNRFVDAQKPEVFTVLGVRDKDLRVALNLAGVTVSRRPTFTFLATFSREGVAMWTSGAAPQPIATIDSERIVGVDYGEFTERPEYGQQSLPRLRVIARGEGAEEVFIEFGLGRLDRASFSRQFVDEVGVQQAILSARAAVSGVANSAESTAAHPMLNRAATLVPGTSAYQAHHFGRITLWQLTVWIPWLVLVPFALVLFLGDGWWWAPPVVLAGIFATFVPLFIRANSASVREFQAGYTTLNGRDLHLEQRHPFTGAVIREAGEKAISAEQFNELLGR